MNKFKIGDEVRCIKVKAGAENWLTGNGIYKIVPYIYNSQEDFVIGDTGEYVNTFWGEFIKENTMFKIRDNVRVVKDCFAYTYTKIGSEGFVTETSIYNDDRVKVRFYKFTGSMPSHVMKYWIKSEDLELINDEIKIGEKVYFICSWSGKKTYGIVRHIGKLPSTLSHHPFIKEVGKDGCIWSEWDKEWDGKINSTRLGWMPKERVHKVCKEDKMFQIGERITENNKNKLICGDIIREDESQAGGNWFVFEREKNPSWFYSWQIFKVTTVKEAVGIFFRRNEKLVNCFFGSHSYHDAGILSQDYNNHKSYYMGNVYDYQQKKVTISKYQELKERIKNVKGWDKEADDILEEIQVNHRIAIRRDAHSNCGEVKVSLCSGWGDTSTAENFSFRNQCEKLEAFKLALLWLLDHSDIKNDEKAEKIKDLEYQRDTFATQVRSLNLQIEELMGVKK